MRVFLLYFSFILSLFLLKSCFPSSALTSDTSSDENKEEFYNGRKTIVRQAGNLELIEKDTLSLEPNPYSSLVEMETPYGKMKIELFFETQFHRENFIKLIKSSYYDSLMFHRVIKNFMAQGGDPKSKYATKGQRLGANSIGYNLDAEIGQHYYHIKGALAAARQSDDMNPLKRSSGSQFYIVQGTHVSMDQLDKNERKYDIIYTQEQRELYQQLGGSPQLDMEYTVFGRVYEGFNVIDSICFQTTDNYSRPLKDIRYSFKVTRE